MVNFGRPRDFWTINLNAIKEMIESFKLTPAQIHDLPYRQEIQAMENMTVTAGKERVARHPKFPGGMLIPHLHYGDNVYLVSDEDWQEISTQIKRNFMEKLDRANNLSFSQVMALSGVIDSV